MYHKKKIQIAVCDDEKKVCSDLEMMLLKIGIRLNIEVDVELWYTGEGLCEYSIADSYL